MGFGLAGAVVIFAISVYLPNIGLVAEILASSQFDVWGKLVFLWNSLGAISTNASTLSAALIISNAVLFGVNVALFSFLVSGKQKQMLARGGASSAGAMLVGLLGVGCASCGAILLGPFLAFFGAAGILSALPLGGGELAAISVFLLLFSIGYISRQAMRNIAG